MGSESSRTTRHQEGNKVDPTKAPVYFHTIERGNASDPSDGTSADRINSAMSNVKVSTGDASSLQEKLQNEYFTKWSENCEANEYHGYSFDQIDSLLHKIGEKFNINGVNIYSKMSGIHFSEAIEVKIYDFTFGEQLNSGEFHFGMVAVSKSKESVDAVACLYTLNFAIATVRCEEKTQEKILGINGSVKRRSWTETKSLGFITEKSLENFGRVKALTEFKDRNLVSSINDVNSLDNI